ncbi:hypothetical protein LCGC14_0986470 [marine sediment metagenome]|uniref:Uncharacterized protein n=1 Tax=marine sediment metagenome TaxID=412755 RepID=A0A0F9N757_9ZZZZ
MPSKGSKLDTIKWYRCPYCKVGMRKSSLGKNWHKCTKCGATHFVFTKRKRK